MRQFSAQIMSANLFLLVVVFIAGFFVSPLGPYGNAFDVLVAIAALFCVTVHSITYTYFIAASKFAQRAVEEHGAGDESAVRQSRSIKRKCSRYLYLAMLAAMIGVFLYFWSLPDAHGVGPWRGWAIVGGLLVLSMNAAIIRPVMKYVAASCVLNDGLLASVTKAESA